MTKDDPSLKSQLLVAPNAPGVTQSVDAAAARERGSAGEPLRSCDRLPASMRLPYPRSQRLAIPVLSAC